MLSFSHYCVGSMFISAFHSLQPATSANELQRAALTRIELWIEQNVLVNKTDPILRRQRIWWVSAGAISRPLMCVSYSCTVVCNSCWEEIGRILVFSFTLSLNFSGIEHLNLCKYVKILTLLKVMIIRLRTWPFWWVLKANAIGSAFYPKMQLLFFFF